ncbi:MAG TPA: hypothetical protein VM222_08255 [Planctomycetota bacterium]|nr:hypothetical protein [Planctomycetota bacterium]
MRPLLLALALSFAQDPPPGELLPNGIRLPAEWPPRPKEAPAGLIVPPYLQSPPAVLPIDLGRQLFVDDFLIAETTLKRTFHSATYHPKSPVLRPDKAWEEDKAGGVAMSFSDGVWFDPRDRLFKMWYMAGSARHTCLATSKDGLVWEKPELDVKPGTNIVQSGSRDSSTVWLDLEEKDPARRYKMFRSGPGASTVPKAYGLATFFSPDGIHWSDPPLKTGSCGDRSTVFWNPFRKVWVYSLRHGWGEPRRRRYWEMKDPATGPAWSAIGEPGWWAGADELDPMREDYKVPCQLYNLDGVAYESLILGLFTVWRGQFPDRQKPNEVCVGFSRDGWNWSRPDRRAFLPVSETFGDWNYSNVQSVGGGCLVVGDELWFYVSGRSGAAKGSSKQGTCVTGLATLRRDGFASMDAGSEPGTLTTRLLTFQGSRIFVNADVSEGELGVEVLDGDRTVRTSTPIRANGTKLPVAFKEGDLTGLAGKPLKLRFNLKQGRLYSFWVSSDAGGASGGYAAGGGPGFDGPRDLPPGK